MSVMRWRWRATPLLSLYAAFAFFSVSPASCDVGFESEGGYRLDQEDSLGPYSWAMTPEGCRVGSPGNLVVSPLGGTDKEGGQLLDTWHAGAELCAWLSLMQNLHDSLETAWNEAHQRRRSEVSFWRVFKRFSLWRMKFPALRIRVRVLYLDLWHKDRFGFNMPWIRAEFSYGCPEQEEGYGLFDHFCGSVFSTASDQRVPSQVHLLLQPRLAFNKPLSVGASNWQFVTGFLAGLPAGENNEHKKDVAVAWDWAAAVYGRLSAFISLKAHIDEFWMNRGTCYFRSLLRMEWRLLAETICQKLHREAGKGVVGAIKAAKVNSVRLNVTGLDLFKRRRPVLWGLVSEGVVGINTSSAFLRMEIDTNPANVPDYERARHTAQKVRVASLALKGLKWLMEEDLSFVALLSASSLGSMLHVRRNPPVLPIASPGATGADELPGGISLFVNELSALEGRLPPGGATCAAAVVLVD
ncbi:hypothetical protein Efla_004133 [Eimeria flavescens]